jgi:HK97 family phage portal protein
LQKNWFKQIASKAARVADYSLVLKPRVRSLTQVGAEPWYKFFGNEVAFNNWNHDKFIKDGFKGNATVYSIVTRITSVAAQAAETFAVYRVKDSKKALLYKSFTGARATSESLQRALVLKNQAFELDTSHSFNDWLARPNPWQGPNEFLQMCIGFKLLTGNRFLLKVGPDKGANAGKVKWVYNLPPQHMNIIREESSLWGIRAYQLMLGSEIKIPGETIIQSRFWNPTYDLSGSHLWGLSPLEAASRRIDIARFAEDRTGAQMKTSGAAGVLYNKNATKPPDEKLKKVLNEEVLGLDNVEKIVMMSGDLGFLQFGMKATDLQIIEQERYTDERLCNVYRVPSGLFMANANATDNNISGWNRQLVTQAVIPALADVRDDYNRICQDQYGPGYYVDYDVNIFPEMQEDAEKLARVLANSPYLTQNEKRIIRGYDEDLAEPMMSKYLYPANVVDLSTLNEILPTDVPDEFQREEEPVEEDGFKTIKGSTILLNGHAKK